VPSWCLAWFLSNHKKVWGSIKGLRLDIHPIPLLIFDFLSWKVCLVGVTSYWCYVCEQSLITLQLFIVLQPILVPRSTLCMYEVSDNDVASFEDPNWCCATSKKPGAMQLQLSCINWIDNLYFVINELFCNSSIMLLYIAKEALFVKTALNKYCAQKYLLNCFIVCLSCFPP